MVSRSISHYHILKKLGAGGMGEVWLAEDTRLDRRVALKLLPEPFTRDEDRLRRFVQEAKAASALNHPNILTIFEIGEVEGRHYIATEFIDGQTLRQRMTVERLSLPAALDVAIQTAAALAAAHEAGIIHRDIKPENVMVRRDGIIKVLDFGLAKLTEQQAPSEMGRQAATGAKVTTAPGAVLGTPQYMSPEQARGQKVEFSTDVFSLGVMLYEMVAGRAPFAGVNAMDVIGAILNQEPASMAPLVAEAPRELALRLEQIVGKALRKERNERYQTVNGLLVDLKDLKQELEFVARLSQHATDDVKTMPPEAEPGEGVDIAHVLFCDIVGYSLLPIDRQTQMMQTRQQIVRQTEDYRRAEGRQQLVRLPAGDGMALAFLQDPVAPVRCAIEIARALQTHPDIRLRMGVHSGPVFRSADINANRNVVGSGINLAQRVMDSGDAGHILVSRNVAEVLSQVSQWQAYLHDLGEVEKHGVRIHLYNIYSDEVGNAEAPAKVRARTSATPQATSSAKVILGEVKRHKLGLAGLLVVLAVATGAAWFFLFARSEQSAIRALAVLPFVNMGDDPNTEYLSDGISESLINKLSQLPELKVIARSSSFRYRGKEADLQQVGKSLGVEGVLTGRVLLRGDNLQINVELVNARDKTHVWGEQYNRKAADLLQVQQEIVREISERLRSRLTGSERQELTKRYTDNVEAYQLYLKGRFHLSKRMRDHMQRGIEYFQQTLALDPNYALAHAGLADAYNILPSMAMSSPHESMPKAKAAAKRALELDETLAEAHMALAYNLARYDYNWAEAEREFKRAIELNPNYANGRMYYATIYLAPIGRLDEAIAEITRALELDPLSPLINLNLAMTQFHARRYDQALEQVRKALELDPNYPTAFYTLAWVYIAKGMYDEAITQALKMGQGDLVATSNLGCAYAKAGRRREALEALNQLTDAASNRYVQPYFIARVYVALDDINQAFVQLEKACEQRDAWLSRIKLDPAFDGLKEDPRFADLVRRIGLTP